MSGEETILISDFTFNRHGFPCLWEQGGLGEGGEYGSATLIAGPKGGKVKADFVFRQDASTENGLHARIPIRVGSLVIMADVASNTSVRVWQIGEIDFNEVHFVASLEGEYYKDIHGKSYMQLYNKDWLKAKEPPLNVMKAMGIAKKKALMPSCLQAMYVQSSTHRSQLGVTGRVIHRYQAYPEPSEANPSKRFAKMKRRGNVFYPFEKKREKSEKT